MDPYHQQPRPSEDGSTRPQTAGASLGQQDTAYEPTNHVPLGVAVHSQDSQHANDLGVTSTSVGGVKGFYPSEGDPNDREFARKYFSASQQRAHQQYMAATAHHTAPSSGGSATAGRGRGGGRRFRPRTKMRRQQASTFATGVSVRPKSSEQQAAMANEEGYRQRLQQFQQQQYRNHTQMTSPEPFPAQTPVREDSMLNPAAAVYCPVRVSQPTHPDDQPLPPGTISPTQLSGVSRPVSPSWPPSTPQTVSTSGTHLKAPQPRKEFTGDLEATLRQDGTSALSTSSRWDTVTGTHQTRDTEELPAFVVTITKPLSDDDGDTDGVVRLPLGSFDPGSTATPADRAARTQQWVSSSTGEPVGDKRHLSIAELGGEPDGYPGSAASTTGSNSGTIGDHRPSSAASRRSEGREAGSQTSAYTSQYSGKGGWS